MSLLVQFAADVSNLINDTNGLAEEIVITDADGNPVTYRGWWRNDDPAPGGNILSSSSTVTQTATAFIRVSDFAAPDYNSSYHLASRPDDIFHVVDRQRDTAGGLWKILLERRNPVGVGPALAGQGA